MEKRRFRTWEENAPVPSDRWRVVFRYALERSRRTWYVGLLAVAAVVTLIFEAGTLVSGDAGVAQAEGLRLAIVFSMAFGAVVLLLVGAPSLAEDRRFNAPLLYFSKPLTPESYLIGKAAHLGLLLSLVVLLPVLVLFLLAFMASLGSGEPTDAGRALGGDSLHEWRVSHLDSPVDVILGLLAVLPGMAVASAWCAAAVMAASSYTSRAWHAALGAIAGIAVPSMAGSILAQGSEGTYGLLTGPAQWITAVVWLPMDLLYSPYANPLTGPAPQQYDGALATVPLAYFLLITTGAGLCWLTLQRTRRVEAML